MSAPSSQEKADNYRAIVVRLNANWRVIECRDSMQWILQKSKGLYAGRTAWKAQAYFRTRAGLVRRIGETCGQVDGRAMAVAFSLPERLGDRQ